MEHDQVMHIMYIVGIVMIAAGMYAAVTIDTSDQGECKRGMNGEIMVRQPETKSFAHSIMKPILYLRAI